MISILFRFIIALIFAVLLSVNLLGKNKDKISTPIIEPYTLPLCITVFFVVSVFFTGGAYTVENMMSAFFPIFFHIGIYYAILLLIMPCLRNLFSTEITSLLWIIPNYLYIMNFVGYRLEKPLYTFKISGSWAKYIPLIWFGGFWAVFLYKMISHVVFRVKLLKNSDKVTDDRVLKLWKEEKSKVKIKNNNIPLYVSEAVKTPVSVGLFKRGIFVVLPTKNFTESELSLIFRHELIHIARSDGWTKFFIMFCNAACWFNPLMWISMKKCSEDIELSCDETALIDEDNSVRKQYAELILSSAGDERGFTSCLSASAKSLQFRLKSIMNPRKKKKGFVFAGVVFFLLIMTCQTVAFALDFGMAKDVVFSQSSKIDGRITVYKRNKTAMKDIRYYKPKDEKAFLDYIGNLKLYRLTGLYEYDNDEIIFEFNFKDKDGLGHFIVSQGHLSKTVYNGKKSYNEDYIFYEDIDEDYLLSCLEEIDIPVNVSAPELMLYYFDGDKKAYG